MSVVVSHKTIAKFSRATDAKKEITDALGDLEAITVLQNMVLVATYIRPEKTKGGLFLPDSAKEEDVYQGKVGLVLKMGPSAFEDLEEDRFRGVRAFVGDWVVYRVGDSWDLTIRDVPCRLIRDSSIRLIVDDPETIF
jgi:co-chaperonin GroES (HSP10)